jgi:hypothetical protein
MFRLGPDKSPGPDGLTAKFIQKNWRIMGPDVYRIIQQAFATGEAPKEWNACHIVLLPKSDQANTTKDFRPISVGNTLYRLLTKIITDRLLPYMSKIISNT